jgi:16S rRNA (uracil1498-N3)-methyltransferase
MPRFFLAADAWSNPSLLTLSGAEARHALQVLRLRTGDPVQVFDGLGRRADGIVASTSHQQLEVAVSQLSATSPPTALISLAQAIPKGKNMELIIQKATELGTSRIVPLLADRCVSRPSQKEFQARADRWARTALEAAKQCGQDRLPLIDPPTPVPSAAKLEADLKLVASLQPGARPLHRILADLPAPPRSALVLIGPEGDFSNEEYHLALDAGCLPWSLGPITLRTETAAIYSLSVLAHELLSL